MKKTIILLLILTGCTTQPTSVQVENPSANPVSAVMPTSKVAAAIEPAKILEPLEGETRQAFLERQIAQLDAEILKLEPQLISSSNILGPEGQSQTSKIKEQMSDLQRKKASLELQLMSLP